MKNLHVPWRSYDSHDPAIVWRLSPAAGGDARALALDVLAAGEAAGVFTLRAAHVDGIELKAPGGAAAWSALAPQGPGAEALPFGKALFGEGGSVVFESVVAYRDAHGKAHEAAHNDAGALLRSIETDVDEAYLRRFAAARPFVAAYSEGADVVIGFFADAHFVDDDKQGGGQNRARLDRLRAALLALAERHRATAQLPVPR